MENTSLKKSLVDIIPKWAASMALLLFVLLLFISFITGKVLSWSPFGFMDSPKVSEKIINEVIEPRLEILFNGIELPSTGGNSKSAVCPPKSYMIGVRMQSDRGGPHGIVSNVIPVCRNVNLKNN